jgi:hypothetical protein
MPFEEYIAMLPYLSLKAIFVYGFLHGNIASFPVDAALRKANE